MAISLAAAAALAVVAGLLLYRNSTPQLRNSAGIEASPHSRFSLSGGEAGGSAGMLRPGGSLFIAQGTLKLTLADGSVCHADAPARLTMHSARHLSLDGGVARFTVAKGSEGLKVTTADLEVIDLGTVFGVDARLAGQSQVHVIDGKVRATARSGSRESITLSVGQAAAVGGAGKLRPVPAEIVRFPQALPEGLPALHFSFDPDATGRLEAGGRLALQSAVAISRPAGSAGMPSIVPGHRGSALRFSEASQSLATNWAGIAGSLPRTISFWLKIEPGTPEAGHILGWGLPGGTAGMSEFALLYSGGDLANLRIASGRRWLQSSSRLDDGRWHHLAVVLDSYTPGSWPHVKLYVDGAPEALTQRQDEDGRLAPLDSFNTITHHPRSIPFTLGAFRPNATVGALIGEVDEMTLVAGILTEAQIQKLFRGELHTLGLSLSIRPPDP
jgi:hypothetical protein